MCHRSSFKNADWNEPQTKKDWMRYRFYKHLNVFIIVNAIFLFKSIGGGDIGSWKWVALFWGLALYNHYRRVKACQGDDWKKANNKYDDEIVDDVPPPPKDSGWKDKDLV